jgi:hypothetical protein
MDSLISFIIIIIALPIVVFVLTKLPNANTFDVRWATMTGILMLVVCAVWRTYWTWKINESLRTLNLLLIDQDRLLRPELKGVVAALRRRFKEIWKWGLPK